MGEWYELLLTVQHGAAAIDGAAPTSVFFLQVGCFAHIDYETVIVREFFANNDVAQGFEENTVPVLTGFQIRFAGVINPLGGIAMVLGVDDVAVIQMEIEGVIRLAGIVRMTVNGFLPRDNLSFIFQNGVTGFDGTDGVNALAVDVGFAYLNAAFAIRCFRFGINFPGVCF